MSTNPPTCSNIYVVVRGDFLLVAQDSIQTLEAGVMEVQKRVQQIK